jgi:energy-coupling factor transport system permease protein
MIRDITIGQYYPSESIIHRLDPRFKIIAGFIYMISIFLVDQILGYSIVLFFIGLTIALSKIPLKYIIKGLKPIMMIIIFAFVINVFFTPGKALLEFWILRVTEEGLYRGFFMASRLVFLIVGTSLLTLTTSPIKLTDGIERLLNPLKKIGLPAHELAMMMTISLRFIPTLLDETDKIMKAQMARGADFESGSIVKRAKSLIPLLVPLFISAFQRADDLAMAMEARCYRGGDNRTAMKVLKYSIKDLYASLFLIAYLTALVIYKMM